MTWEEAIEELERLLRHWDDLENDKRCFWGYDKEAVALALTALRPVSREQVWRGEWKIITTHNGCTPDQDCVCSRCGASGIPNKPFCDSCGAPMTDEAVEILLKRLEALKDAD